MFVGQAEAVEHGLDGVGAKGRTEERAAQRVAAGGNARVAEQLMVHEKRGTEGTAGVAGGGRDEERVEDFGAGEFSVGDAVESDAAGEAQVARSGEALHFPGHAEDGFLRDKLDGRGEVHLALGEQRLRSARRTFEQGFEFF